jgi:hypothetical protein
MIILQKSNFSLPISDILQNMDNSANLNEGNIMMTRILLTANLGANHAIK